MKRLYLIGYPLGHSLSPAMQNAALRACGLVDWRYKALAAPPEQLGRRVDALRDPECAGANVTIPYKEAIIPFLDVLGDSARSVGAVNTLVKEGGRLLGENTDVTGFTCLLTANGVRPKGACAVILGAGGAAAAVGFALASAGTTRLVILNRTSSRAERLAVRLRAEFSGLELFVNCPELLARAELVVNATSAGMAPNVDSSPLPANPRLDRGSIAVDLVYNPARTRFLDEAERAGARTIGGLDMLVYQGARAFELWTGHAAPVEVMRAAARSALAESRKSSPAD